MLFLAFHNDGDQQEYKQKTSSKQNSVAFFIFSSSSMEDYKVEKYELLKIGLRFLWRTESQF